LHKTFLVKTTKMVLPGVYVC